MASSTAGHNGWRALPLRLRPLARVLQLMELTGLSPSVQKTAASSLAERQSGKPAAWACRPVVGHVLVNDVDVPTRDGVVTVRTYRAADAVGDLPVLVYAHGGGWIMGGLDGVDPFCRRMALQADVAVVSIDYRLAPEHPFPAGLHDCADVLAWVRASPGRGWDSSRVAIGGDSAGGNLTAALALLVRDQPVQAQLLIYPGLDLTLSSRYFRGFRGPGLTQRQCRELVDLYVGDGDRSQELASPLLAADLSDLPPALVLTGGADILADDGERYVTRLLEAGTQARLLHYPRAPHAFLGFDRLLPEAVEATDEIARFLRTHLRTGIPVSS